METIQTPDPDPDAPAPSRGSIPSHYLLCINSCHQLLTLLEAPDCDPPKKRLLSNFADQIGRFRVWAVDAGAHRSERSRVSLNYRLREASHVHTRVTGLLQELDGDLKEGSPPPLHFQNCYELYMVLIWHAAIGILTHGVSKPCWQISIEDDGMGTPTVPLEEDGMESSEVESILSDIEDIITSLYQLSAAIRNPAAKDRLQKIAAIKIPASELLSDFQYISRNFPNAPGFLIERLVGANTRRRKSMKFYRSQHEITPSHLLPSTEATEIHNQDIVRPSRIEDRGFTDIEEESPILNDLDTISTVVKSQMAVSTILPNLSIHNMPTIEATSDDGHSEASDATSENEQSRLHIPTPPSFNAVYDGQPITFKCPYCFTLITIPHLRAWK